MARRKRRWLWVLLFIWMAGLLVTLATGWNVVLLRDYRDMLALASQASSSVTASRPWLGHVLGTLGFAAALATILLFFWKVLKEMKLNQMQSDFLEKVSHELKTPIASIELSSSLLRAGGLTPEEVQRLWSSHQAELKRLREEVMALLEAARIQTKPERENRLPVELELWIEDRFERWSRILGPDGSLKREGTRLEGLATVDLKTMDLIADNLVDNARKFANGQPQLTVRTELLPRRAPWSQARWSIEFSDRGWGFEPADSRRLSGRFFRARTQAPYPIPGNGLGLYLAENAGRSMGVKLRCASQGQGLGASFRLEGPLK